MIPTACGIAPRILGVMQSQLIYLQEMAATITSTLLKLTMMVHNFFRCISCDGKWESHIILYETEPERQQEKKKIRDDYFPLSANKEI